MAVVRSDGVVQREVEAALARDVWVDERRIAVHVAGGVVHLSGAVGSYAEKGYAIDDAWSVSGVADVVDHVALVLPSARPDAEIAGDVRAALARSVRLDPDGIEVAAHEGVVHLRGIVACAERKWLAEDVARRTVGVREVLNELTIS